MIVIGLDLGTTACKGVALASDGQLVASASAGYPLHTPETGRVEQQPDELWRGAVAVLRALSRALGGRPLAALALSGAMHSLLPIGEDERPLAPAATWADGRAQAAGTRLRGEALAQQLYERTGCPPQPLYWPMRLRAWQADAPALAARVRRWVGLKEWVAFELTGRWAMDRGMASTTGLLRLDGAGWDEAALALARVEAARLPPLVATTARLAPLTARAAQATGLPAGLPIVAGSSDGALASLGAGAAAAGETVITVGTSGAIRRTLAAPRLDAAARTWCYTLHEGRWIAGGAINNGGLVLQWGRTQWYPTLAPDEGTQRLLAEAASVEPGADGLLLLPYLTGERSPHWQPDASATLHGLRLHHTRAHLARALLEGVAFCLAELWPLLGAGAGGALPRLTGGICRSPLWGQIVADVLGLPLRPMPGGDASALGAALLAFRALGHEPPVPALPAAPLLLPDARRHALYQERLNAWQRLHRALSAMPPR